MHASGPKSGIDLKTAGAKPLISKRGAICYVAGLGEFLHDAVVTCGPQPEEGSP